MIGLSKIIIMTDCLFYIKDKSQIVSIFFLFLITKPSDYSFDWGSYLFIVWYKKSCVFILHVWAIIIISTETAL